MSSRRLQSISLTPDVALEMNLHGQPQWRKNATRTGTPSSRGNCICGTDGALLLTSGTGLVSTFDGVSHDDSSCLAVMVIEGLSVAL